MVILLRLDNFFVFLILYELRHSHEPVDVVFLLLLFLIFFAIVFSPLIIKFPLLGLNRNSYVLRIYHTIMLIFNCQLLPFSYCLEIKPKKAQFLNKLCFLIKLIC